MNALLFEEQKRLEKIAVNSFYFSLAVVIFSGHSLFLNSSLFANEINLSQTSYLNTNMQIESAPIKIEKEINLFAEKKQWEDSVRKKYKNASTAVIEPGIMHIKTTKHINSGPVRINIVEINRKINPNIDFSPELASSTLARKATVRTIAQKNNSIIAVNGTFFKPSTGVPLGTLMINKKLVTGPVFNRVALGINKDSFKMARLELDAKLSSGLNSITLDNINQPRMSVAHTIIYNRDWGQYSPPPPKYGVILTVSGNKITKISYGSTEIPEEGYVISGPKSKLEPFFNATSVQMDIKTKPDWNDIDHIISGGPYLVKNGNPYVDINDQKLNAISGKNPRTAIGYTKDQDLILVTIDGRETESVGMNIYELAKYMKSIGCENAMNLDGGGSSVMYVKGKVVNNPVMKGGIAISNAFTVNINNSPSAISYNYQEEK